MHQVPVAPGSGRTRFRVNRVPDVPGSGCTGFGWGVPGSGWTRFRLHPVPGVPDSGCSRLRVYQVPVVPGSGCTRFRVHQVPGVPVSVCIALGSGCTRFWVYQAPGVGVQVYEFPGVSGSGSTRLDSIRLDRFRSQVLLRQNNGASQCFSCHPQLVHFLHSINPLRPNLLLYYDEFSSSPVVGSYLMH